MFQIVIHTRSDETSKNTLSIHKLCGTTLLSAPISIFQHFEHLTLTMDLTDHLIRYRINVPVVLRRHNLISDDHPKCKEMVLAMGLNMTFLLGNKLHLNNGNATWMITTIPDPIPLLPNG